MAGQIDALSFIYQQHVMRALRRYFLDFRCSLIYTISKTARGSGCRVRPKKRGGMSRDGWVCVMLLVFTVMPLSAFASVRHPVRLADLAEHGDHAALIRLEQSARSGDAGAQLALGYVLSYGHPDSRQYANADYWYRKAAAQGNATAEFCLGLAYSMGQGVPKNYAKADYWWKKAAVQGNTAAENFLGFAYATGEGVPKNYAKADYWRKKAAAHRRKKVAPATNWFFLDGQTRRCVNAKIFAEEHGSPPFASPFAMRKFLRAKSDWKGFRVFHSKRGRVVDLEMNNGGYLYFSSLPLCRSAQKHEPSLKALQ